MRLVNKLSKLLSPVERDAIYCLILYLLELSVDA